MRAAATKLDFVGGFEMGLNDNLILFVFEPLLMKTTSRESVTLLMHSIHLSCILIETKFGLLLLKKPNHTMRSQIPRYTRGSKWQKISVSGCSGSFWKVKEENVCEIIWYLVVEIGWL